VRRIAVVRVVVEAWSDLVGFRRDVVKALGVALTRS
jgi:hypothetical protein